MGDGAGQVRMGVPRVTVPVRVTVCGLVELEIESFAVGLPASSGVKLTTIEQLPPEASVAPQFVVCANWFAPAPVRVIPAIEMAELKLLAKVTVCEAGAAPTGQTEKFSVD